MVSDTERTMQTQKQRNPPSDRLELSYRWDRLPTIPEKPIPNYLKPTISSWKAAASREHHQPPPQTRCRKLAAAAARTITTMRDTSAAAPPPPATRRRIPATKPRTPTSTLPQGPFLAISSKPRASRPAPKPITITGIVFPKLPGLVKAAPKKAIAFTSRPKVNRAPSIMLAEIPEEEDEKASDARSELAREGSVTVEAKASEGRDMGSKSAEAAEAPPIGDSVFGEAANRVGARNSEVGALARVFETVFSLHKKPEGESSQQEHSQNAAVAEESCSRRWGANSQDEDNRESQWVWEDDLIVYSLREVEHD